MVTQRRRVKNVFGKILQYLTFSAGGVTAFFIQLGVAIVFTEVFHFWHMLSYAISLAAGNIYSFLYHKCITFRSKDHTVKRLIKYSINLVSIDIINWTLVLVATHVLLVKYIDAIIIVSALLSVLSYVTNTFWVFKKIEKKFERVEGKIMGVVKEEIEKVEKIIKK